jgi:hypothetical protein
MANEFPIETYLNLMKQKQDTERSQGSWASALGGGIGAGMMDVAKGNEKIRQDAPAQRAALFKDLISKNILQMNGQQLGADEVMSEFEKYRKSGQLTPGIEMIAIDSFKKPSDMTNVYETDPVTGDITKKMEVEKGSKIVKRPMTIDEDVAQKTARQRAKQETDMGFKREVFGADLKNFLEVDTAIKRGKGGLERFTQGAETMGRRFAQFEGDDQGRAAALHESASKRLRVQLVRAAGDVGNINIVEQEAAEMLIPRIFDSEQVAQAKRIYLKELGKAIESMDPQQIRQALTSMGIRYEDRGSAEKATQSPQTPTDDIEIISVE